MSVSEYDYDSDSDDYDPATVQRRAAANRPREPFVMPTMPTPDEAYEMWLDFTEAVLQNLPTQKEIRAQRKKIRKGYKMFMLEFEEMEWLDPIEDATLLPRSYLLIAIFGVVGTVLVTSFFVLSMGIFVTRMVGLIYPAYASIKALITETKDDDTQWLMYWVIFAGFSLFEQVALEQSKTLPLYFSIKLAVLLLCQFAKFSEFLYKLLIAPFAKAFRLVFGSSEEEEAI